MNYLDFQNYYDGIRDRLIKTSLDVWRVYDERSRTNQNFPDGVVEISDLLYREEDPDGHNLAVYYPEQHNEKLPVVIDIHGGGFLYGTEEINKSYGYHLAKEGFIVFNLNYPTVNSTCKIPDQMLDLISAMNWIGDHLRDFPADRERVFLTGDSAGGYYATLISLITKSERLQKTFDSEPLKMDIKALGVSSGLFDIEDQFVGFKQLRSVCFEPNYWHKPYYESMQFNLLPEIVLLPPVFLITTEKDFLRYHTIQFTQLLKKHKKAFHLEDIPDNKNYKLEHVFNIIYPDRKESRKVNTGMLKYFLKQTGI